MQPALTTTRNDLIVSANRSKRMGTEFAVRKRWAAARDAYTEAADLYARAGAEGWAAEARQDAEACQGNVRRLLMREPLRVITVNGQVVS